MPLSDNKGIWLFYSKKGNLISKVPNGNSIRQGGSFTLIFAFEDDNYMEHKNFSVSFQRPGDKNQTISYPFGETEPIQFKKYKPNEITYGLIDGKTYNVYREVFDPSSGITTKYGSLNVIAKIKSEEDEDLVYYEGAVQLYIEPTYGKSEDNSFISRTESEQLTDLINNIANAKLNKVNGEASLLKITTTPLAPEHAVRKDYVDEVDAKKLNKVGDIAKDLKVEKTPTDDLDVVNKIHLDNKLINYIYAEDNSLIKNGVKINPQTLADVVYLKEQGVYGITVAGKIAEIIKSIEDLQGALNESVRFKGKYSSVEEAKQSLENEGITPIPGDYIIIVHEGEDDELYIWDADKQDWISKGNVVKSFVDEVNGQVGKVVLTDKNIYTTDLIEPGTEGKDKFTINDVLSLILRLYATKEEVDAVNAKMLNFRDEWISGNEYREKDIVSYGKNLYICIADVAEGNKTNPSEDSTHWGIFVEGFNGDYNSLINKPTKVSQFENDGDGTSRYATEAYVATNGGKIDSISVNGEKQAIDENKNVEISLPTFTILED